MLIADRVDSTQPAPSGFRQHYDSLRRVVEFPGIPAQDSEDFLEFASLLQDAIPYSDQVGYKCKNRRSAVTYKKYKGLIPPTVKIGDLAVILDGGRVPFVLRRSGKNFRLIGDCYIHGIMHGEAAPSVQEVICRRKFRSLYASHSAHEWRDFLLE